MAAKTECHVELAKLNKERFTVSFFKNGVRIRDGVWRSRNKILDELKKSGALHSKINNWPKFFGDIVIFEVKEPLNWFWNE